jgi:hypothetical protein
MQEFGDKVQLNGELKGVNVGSTQNPIWYAQELLKVLPDQIHKHTLPKGLVTTILAKCKPTSDMKARMDEEALGGFGIMSIPAELTFLVRSTLSVGYRKIY